MGGLVPPPPPPRRHRPCGSLKRDSPHTQIIARHDDAVALLEQLDLKEYEATALAHFLEFGRATAPTISEATGIPKARVYGVLESLSDKGFIKIIPRSAKGILGEITHRNSQSGR
ncbi:helix-turn-helix domain-containing protein [Natronosalvus rutilus]|uniref:Helix-turn-helix domain-containing protein n=2 Tax=Natronosalvus rutilus TaxID=2953753 RepID=A0A9E7SV29_9EURY|nr:helix-turn-helix domain-containing protein [Natronosalvus rutilus]